MQVDILIKNGKIVIPKVGILEASLAIDGENIVAITNDEKSFPADKTINANVSMCFPE